MTSEQDRLRQIEELRLEIHRRMGGRYDPVQLANLVTISQELDKLVVEVTRQQWSRNGGPTPGTESNGGGQQGRPRRKRR